MRDSVLTIIMPCYNGGGTIVRALESILSQITNYRYDILVINDASTDNSATIVEAYCDKHSNIRVITNLQNEGNALSFYKALCNIKTKYFAVLDVDDYYTHPMKLQRQIDVLEQDSSERYVAVTHYYVHDFGNGRVSIPRFPDVDSFTYIDFLKQRSGYYHTSTYVYRNIFNGRPPEIFRTVRGDTIRTAIHLSYSNKEVKVLRMVASAYYWSGSGIWTSLNQKRQFELQLKIWSTLRDNSATEFERECYSKLMDDVVNKSKDAKDEYRHYDDVSIDDALNSLVLSSRQYAFHGEREYVFRGLYYSEYVDSMSVTLGNIFFSYRPCYTEKLSQSICVIVPTLKPKGGGIFREICELCSMHSKDDVHVLVTGLSESDSSAKGILAKLGNVHVHICPNGEPRSLFLVDLIRDIAPCRTYIYDSHEDPYPFALMDRRSENVCMFSYDHGFVNGISNPYLDIIVAKRPVDYHMLKAAFGDKVKYIPAWNDESKIHMVYKPFNNHKTLITACGAARYYKIGSAGGTTYPDLISKLLSQTGGKHIHFGPIPTDEKEHIASLMQERGVPLDAFVHIEWAEDPPGLLLDNNVDLFIEPFPTVSYKITLDMFMCGIPVIFYNGHTRMSKADFVYDEHLFWNDEADFLNTVTSLSKEDLENHSRLSKEYYKLNHTRCSVSEYLLGGREHTVPDIMATDAYVHAVESFPSLFNSSKSKPTSHAHVINDKSFVLGPIIDILQKLDYKIVCSTKIKNKDVTSAEIQRLIESEKKSDNVHAVRLCKKHKKYPVAQGWLGRMYSKGYCVQPNMEMAIEWYTKSCEGNGPTWAYVELSDILLKTKDPTNHKCAYKYCTIASQKGSPAAMGRLARMCRDGIGCNQDLDTAKFWMKRAAESGVKWAKKEYEELCNTKNNL